MSGNATVNVHPLPVPEAGIDVTIPHGTTAVLLGSASAGSGSYNYHWEPADKLVDANIAHPQTVNLFSSTLFTLFVTDITYGCEADAPDQMTVIISGDALAVNPSVSDDEICFGESTQLFALAGGGSGIYEYYWTSVPAGFTSTEENPIAEPIVSTVYSVSITDGYTDVNGSASVTVNPTPIVALGPDATVCVFDTLTLDAGNPGSSYIWSNGSTDKIIRVATTGIGFDMKTISVTVTSPEGCVATDQRTLVFDFAACSGIEDPAVESNFHIYPNPAGDKVYVELVHNNGEDCKIELFDISGKLVTIILQVATSQ
jgi:hypothetical protein